jgi:hypothetical protein
MSTQLDASLLVLSEIYLVTFEVRGRIVRWKMTRSMEIPRALSSS